jgi:hypothetical protein
MLALWLVACGSRALLIDDETTGRAIDIGNFLDDIQDVLRRQVGLLKHEQRPSQDVALKPSPDLFYLFQVREPFESPPRLPGTPHALWRSIRSIPSSIVLKTELQRSFAFRK